MSALQKYTVKGHAFVPVQVQVSVEAHNENHAKAIAQRIWDETREKERYVIGNSYDDGAVWGFQANEAEPHL